MGRPIPSFHGFVGQRDIVRSLHEHCRGAAAKGEPLPHIRLDGPSGSGKTRLAKAVAQEMGTSCHDFYSSKQSKKWQLAESLSQIKKADIVFIDEIHALPQESQEALYPAIDRLEVPEVDADKHCVVENKWRRIPPFTLIAATDQPGKLQKALRQRLVLRYTLTDYTESELRQIVFNYAAEHNMLLKPQAATRLAQAARGIPRRARHLLESLRTVMSDLNVEITKVHVDRHLKSLGIDSDNLTPTDLRYLSILQKGGGRMSLASLALQLGLDADTVYQETETYLQRKGLMNIGCGGRHLTDAGRKIVEERGL
jgi:Holliday junction DNA helicase RuvB